MPQRVSDIFQISPAVLRNNNVYNGFIKIDSLFFVDPRLLKRTKAEELQNSYKKVENYFKDVLKLIKIYLNYQNKGDEQKAKNIYLEIIQKLKFPETALTGLGYSINKNDGKGIGDKSATKLCDNAVKLVEIGIEDPIIFELAGVFQEGFDSDKISDMIIRIIISDIFKFSVRIARDLNLPISKVLTYVDGEDYALPCRPNEVNVRPSQGFLLLPEDILTLLPFAHSLKYTDLVTLDNYELRLYVNKMMGWGYFDDTTWKHLYDNKFKLNKIIIEKSAIMKDLINKYMSKKFEPYDFNNDPDDKFKWHDTARRYAKLHPLDIKDFTHKDFIGDEELIEKICVHFCKLVNLGLNDAFYKEPGKPKKEKTGLLILLELLECYLENTSLKIEYLEDNKVINLYGLSNLYKFTLKFTSTREINLFYKNLICNLSYNYHSDNYQWWRNGITILFLIEVDRGKRIDDIVNQPDIIHNDKAINCLRMFPIYKTS